MQSRPQVVDDNLNNLRNKLKKKKLISLLINR